MSRSLPDCTLSMLYSSCLYVLIVPSSATNLSMMRLMYSKERPSPVLSQTASTPVSATPCSYVHLSGLDGSPLTASGQSVMTVVAMRCERGAAACPRAVAEQADMTTRAMIIFALRFKGTPSVMNFALSVYDQSGGRDL